MLLRLKVLDSEDTVVGDYYLTGGIALGENKNFARPMLLQEFRNGEWFDIPFVVEITAETKQ
jgi:hypothetical protein